MSIKTLIEDITLVTEAGDTEDALDLSRELVRAGHVKHAIDVRRSVTKGVLDRDFLLNLAATITEDTASHQDWIAREAFALLAEARDLFPEVVGRTHFRAA